MLSEPVLPYSLPHPVKLEPVQTYYIDYVDTPPDQKPSHELRSIVSVNHHYFPVLPHAYGTQAAPLCSNMAFTSSFGRDLNPTYTFQHTYIGLAGKRPFLRRAAAPTVKRMAFEQDYMDTNTTERFPVGHALDLRGHELVALGHSCAAWIEARAPTMPIIVIRDYDQIEYELKLAIFPWSMEEGEKMDGDGDAGLTVCTVKCPPEVDLAKVTGLWLDAVQGTIFLGLKWGKFMILQFD